LKLFASPDDGGHRGLTAPPIKDRNPEPNGDLPCEKIQAKAACSLTTGTFNLLSKILTTLRLSGAVWIEGTDWLPSVLELVRDCLAAFTYIAAFDRL